VRGDSLRDLYAKALALAGLAVLAGAGALFDYWPVSNDFPRIAGPARPSLTIVPQFDSIPSLTLVRDSVAVVARRETRRPPAAITSTRAAEGSSATASPTFALAVLAVSPMALMRLGAPATLGPLASAAAPTSDAVALTEDLALPVVDMRVAEAPFSGSVAHFAAPVQDDDQSTMGFVTDAFKKTGRTLMRTGVKTGATIRDALLRVGGAFKKVL
jgi:hypothetical protein